MRRLDEQAEHIEDTGEPSVPQDTPKQALLDQLCEMLDRQSDADRAILLLQLAGNSYREIAEVIGKWLSRV